MKLNAEGRLNEVQIDDVMGELERHYSTYKRLHDYYMGLNPTITYKPHVDDPDNRVPVPIARKIVSTIKGYAYRPGYLSYEAEGRLDDAIREVHEENDEHLLTGEIAGDVLTYGIAFEVLRYSAADVAAPLTIKQYKIPPTQGVAVFGDTLDKPLIAFIHQVQQKDAQMRDIWVRTIYYADVFQVWQAGGQFGEWTLVSETQHNFGAVPVIVYCGNADYLPVFKPVISMIDELDKVMSNSYADERERFAKAYLLLLDQIDDETEDENGETDADKIRRNALFQDLRGAGDTKSVKDAVDFLVKPSRGEDTAEEANRLERLIYEMSMVINPNDDEFNSASGIALKYKLLAMEWLCADIDGYFDKGLQRRFRLIANASGIPFERVSIQHRRNVPEDLLDMAMTANAMAGQPISKEKIIEKAYSREIFPDPGQVVSEYEESRPELPLPSVGSDEEQEIINGDS